MQKYSDTVLDRNGTVVSGATVSVTSYPSGAAATVYSADSTSGANANPLTTDSNGYFEFWAPNGQYSLTISKTGITTRTVSNILIQDVQVSVTEYGAKGDGTTDDLTAIQAAIDAVSTAGGGTVTFPVGTFLVSGSIEYKSNITILGAGRGATIIKLKSGSTLDSAHGIIQPTGYATLPATGWYTNNTTFAHFSINGNIAGNGGHTYEGITLAGAKNSLCYDVEAYNCGECGFHGQVSNSGSDLKQAVCFQGCVAHDNTADGFQVGGAMVSDCYAYNNGGSGFDSVGNFVTGSGIAIYTQIVNCRAEANSAGGITAVLQSGPHIHTLISNCVAYGNTGKGIAAAMKYTTIANCDSQYNTEDGIYIQFDRCSVTGGRSCNNGQSSTGATNFRSGVCIVGGLNYINVTGVTCTDEQGSPTQQYGVAFTAPGSGSNNVLADCILSGNAVQATYQLTSATDWRVINNVGVNPIGPFNGTAPAPANPSVPATTVAQTNNYGYPCLVTISGGTVTVIKINSVTTGLTSGAFTVGAGETIAITYSVAPTWQWYGL